MTHEITFSLDTLEQVAHSFLNQFDAPKILLFQGEMGAGKTTFIQQLLRKLGVEHPEGSPTYSIIEEYHTQNGTPIYHLDCFRLESEIEALNIGLYDLLEEKAWFFIEWPEKIEKLLPNDVIWLYLRVNSDTTKRILSYSL
ncbi:MAG: tRNA ((37)-N6)-threonylcarbamoyltransferase complex ATPase subunit type 1 TsaE [Bacteroidota bacterium]|jgi:tRNA threonylcarbamoyladenosine biosynthesis protein TsaE